MYVHQWPLLTNCKYSLKNSWSSILHLKSWWDGAVAVLGICYRERRGKLIRLSITLLQTRNKSRLNEQKKIQNDEVNFSGYTWLIFSSRNFVLVEFRKSRNIWKMLTIWSSHKNVDILRCRSFKAERRDELGDIAELTLTKSIKI